MMQSVNGGGVAPSGGNVGVFLDGIEKIASTAPGIQVLEQAAQAAYEPQAAASLGLRVMLDSAGRPVTIATASGVTATAFIDRSGNVLIAYQGTTNAAQYQLDLGIIAGTAGSKLAGFSDALGFARHVQAVAASEGIAGTRIYVTGHSLGGTLSSYVASQTGLAGASFAASGIPGYHAPATPAADFINYVDRGDPFANYGTDTAEKASAVVANKAMDHYGSVVQLGSAADAAALAPFAAAIGGYSPAQLLSGATPATPAQVTALTNAFYGLLGTYHGLPGYASAANMTAIPNSAYGLHTVALSTILATVVGDMPRLRADVPTLLQASSYAVALHAFQSEFPVLSAEITSFVHAPDFAGAFTDIVADLPSLAADFTDPAKLGPLLAGIANSLSGGRPTSLGGGAALVDHLAAASSGGYAAAISHIHA
ncbi:hypothetical protein [Lichenicola sp.]|uniref:hypothetical protein n=1 Tax=Lichenicola sp. TaxID=2804529 RepID=UPI003AFF6FD7